MNYIKKPCKHCPFRNDITPFLHPQRAYELAVHAQNPYNTFPCHKTVEYLDEVGWDDEQIADLSASKECAGFLTMRARGTDRGLPKGFIPSFDICYEDSYDMKDAYQEEWDKQRTKPKE